jgi:hypothetical protein
MLLSGGWRPHGESKVGWRNPLESRQAPTLNLFKTAADKRAQETELGHRRFAEYAEMFRADDIDFMILRELTDQDLERWA